MGSGSSTPHTVPSQKTILHLKNTYVNESRQEIEKQVATLLKDVTTGYVNKNNMDNIEKHNTSMKSNYDNKENTENSNTNYTKKKSVNKYDDSTLDFSFSKLSTSSIERNRNIDSHKNQQSITFGNNITFTSNKSPRKTSSMISKWDNNATDYFNRKKNRTNNNNHTSSPVITQQQQENIDNNNSPVFYADPKCHKYYVSKVLASMRKDTMRCSNNSSPTNYAEKLFKKHWEIVGNKSLGVGSSATVFAAVSTIDPRVKVAVKMLDKMKLSLSMSKKRKLLVMSRNEASLIQKLNHPNIAKFVAYYETNSHIYIISEHCDGGELFEYIIDRPEGLNENEGKIITRQLAAALSHMHQRGVMHRDVKPENILLERKNDLSSIKFIDFGLSREAKESQSFLGTAGYVAPEMASNSYNCGVYDSSVDMWALGVTLYAALTGYMPFEESDEGDSLARGVERIQEQTVQFPSDVFQGISKECIDCLSMLLTIDPKMRITADELLLHPWINDGNRNNGRNAHTPDSDIKLKRKQQIMQILRYGS